MAKIDETLKSSFSLIKNNPKLTVPFVLSHMFNYVLIFSLISIFAINQQGKYIIENISNLEIILFFIFGFILWIIILTYFSCWGFYQNARYTMGYQIKLIHSAYKSLRYLLKLILVNIVFFFLMAIPLVISSFLVILIYYFTQSILLTILTGVLLILITIILSFFILIRIIFAQADIFLNTKKKVSVLQYFENSYKFSKTNTLSVILLIIIIVAINMIGSMFTSAPFSNAILELFRQIHWIIFLIIGFLFFMVVSIISGSVSAFNNLLILNFYYDSKDKSTAKKKEKDKKST